MSEEKTPEQKKEEWFAEIEQILTTSTQTLNLSLNQAKNAQDNPQEAIGNLIISVEAMRDIIGVTVALLKSEMDNFNAYLVGCGAETYILSEILVDKGFTTKEELLERKKQLLQEEIDNG